MLADIDARRAARRASLACAANLIRHARRRGIVLWVEGGGIGWQAPPGGMTERIRDVLAAHREEVIAELYCEAEDRDNLPYFGWVRLRPDGEIRWLAAQDEAEWWNDDAPGCPTWTELEAHARTRANRWQRIATGAPTL